MISYVRGTVQSNFAGELTVIPDNSGLGFSIQVANGADYNIGAAITLYIYSHWNQDQGLALYGFDNLVAKQIFKLILSCQGVGPKIGLAILGQLSPQQFIGAINNGDLNLLSSVNGIGLKKAEQMVILLRTKTQKLMLSGELDLAQAPGVISYGRRLTDTLTALNYGPYEVAQAVQHVGKQAAQQELQFDSALRTALAFLSKSN
jgi:Holliday junction DNA helicase RuvA